MADYEFESQAKDGLVGKIAVSGVPTPTDWNGTWERFLSASVDASSAEDYIIAHFFWFWVEEFDVYAVYGFRGFLSFDTSSLTGKTIISAKLKIYDQGSVICGFETEHIINVYQQAWDILDADDWDGGILVGSMDGADIVSYQYNEISIDPSYINKEGETQLKIAWKDDMDGYVPACDPAEYGSPPGAYDYYAVGAGSLWFSSGDAVSNKPILVVTTTTVLVVTTTTAPVADFSATPLSGKYPLTVKFTDSSTNTPTSWLWSFGDGSTSTLQNPIHKYTTNGSFTVSLTATNAGGSDTETKANYILASVRSILTRTEDRKRRIPLIGRGLASARVLAPARDPKPVRQLR